MPLVKVETIEKVWSTDGDGNKTSDMEPVTRVTGFTAKMWANVRDLKETDVKRTLATVKDVAAYKDMSEADAQDLIDNYDGARPTARPNVADSIAHIKTLTEVAEITAYIEGEDRVTVTKAAEAQIKKLEDA